MIHYVYDGTFNGFLTCVFNSFERKEWDVELYDSNAYQPNLIVPHRTIETNIDHANRVRTGLNKKIGKASAFAFLTCLLSEDRIAIQYAFSILQKIFKNQPTILENYGDAAVIYVHQTIKKVNRERHRMKAFIRFEKAGDGMYYAIVAPDFNVLPLIASFFKKRYSDQRWLIYDEKRKYGIYYDLQQVSEVQFTHEDIADHHESTLVQIDETEIHYQNLWRCYFKNTTIEARKNLKLHLRHVPKRYWKYLVEKKEQ